MTLLEEHLSDNLINMKKTMTATEVARNFSDVLDAVVAGDEITITRGKRPIAVLGSVKDETPNSVRLAAALREHFDKYGYITQEEADERIAAIRADRDADLALEIERGVWNT
jgi:prevent-host-death family protein